MNGQSFTCVINLLNHALDPRDVLFGLSLSSKTKEAFQSSSLILYATDISISTNKFGILTKTIGSFSVHLLEVKGEGRLCMFTTALGGVLSFHFPVSLRMLP